MKRTIALLLALVMSLCLLTSCSGGTPVIETASYFDMSAYDTSKPIKFEIVMESGDRMEGELYYNIAPITVANFVTLADKDFYNGLTFHRVVADTLIQGGCQYGDGSSGFHNTEYTIRGEFSDNGWNNTLNHNQGVLSMARYDNDSNSAYSQFFICATNYPVFDNKYAAFGKITSGLNIVTKLSNVEATDSVPNEDLVIAEINILGN